MRRSWLHLSFFQQRYSGGEAQLSGGNVRLLEQLEVARLCVEMGVVGVHEREEVQFAGGETAAREIEHLPRRFEQISACPPRLFDQARELGITLAQARESVALS